MSYAVVWNEPGEADVDFAGSLELARDTQGPSQAFHLRWVSPFEQKFTYTNDKWTEAARVYSPFTDLSLKAGDTGEEVFWFDPPSGNFSFQPGQYTACVRFVSAGKGRVPSGVKTGQSRPPADCSCSITFNLDSELLGSLSSGGQDSVPVYAKESSAGGAAQ